MTLKIYRPDEDAEEEGPARRIGLFGGSFDPVHHGHLGLAKACKAAAQLDEIWFIPTTVQPLKPYGPVASNEDRLTMLRLAIESLPPEEQEGLYVSTIETDRGGTSYTYDTLQTICKQNASAELFLLMGADTLRDFSKWHEPAEVLSMASPIVVNRAGEGLPDFEVVAEYVSEERLKEFHELVVTMPPMAISSSEIRERLAKGQPIHEQLPKELAKYLLANKIYQSD